MFYTFFWLFLCCISLFVRCPLSSMNRRRQKTAKDRRKSSSDRPLEIRRHGFHCVDSAPTSKLRRKRSLCVRQSLFMFAPTNNAKQVICCTKKCSSVASRNPHCL